MNIFITRQDQTLGPFDQGTVQSKLQSGELSPHDLAWSEGVPDWQPLQVLLGTAMPAAGQVHSLGHLPPYVGEPTGGQVPSVPSQPGPPMPAAPAPPTDSTTGATTPTVSPWLQAIGALLLLLVLWSGRHFFAVLGILVLPVLLLVVWNRPERLRFLFRQYSEKRIVRGALGAAIVLCFVVITQTPSATPTGAAPGSSESGSSESGGAASSATTNAAQRRVEDAEARALRAEAAKKNAERDREQLAQQLRDEGRQNREAARLAAMPTPTPVDPDAPKTNWLGDHHITGQMKVYDAGVRLYNDDKFDWTQVQLSVNGAFNGYGTTVEEIPAGQSVFIAFSDLAKSGGERFSPALKVMNGTVFCKTRYGNGSCMFQF